MLAIFLLAAPAQALTPDEIALVVNSRVPEGRALAELYAAQRHISPGRIIEINVDVGPAASPAEDIPFGGYESWVAAPVRAFLTQHELTQKVTCLVTFWGVPLRIERRVLTVAEKQEQETIKDELSDTQASIARQVAAVEQSATQLDPSFRPATGGELPQLAARLNAALTTTMRGVSAIRDPAARGARFLSAISAIERLIGSARTTLVMSEPAVARLAPQPPTPQQVDSSRAALAEAEQKIGQTQAYVTTSAGRQQAREAAREALGLFGYAGVLLAQSESLRPEESESAVDSELALLWWKEYPRARWLPNPLQRRVRQAARSSPFPTLMVTRLDGPSPQIVRDIILNSIKVEQEGLKGQVVLDGRGKPATDPYGGYDQTIRNLHTLLASKTQLSITFDDKEALIPAHSLKEPIALYCGWYSLRNYSPPGPFAAGAVAFHVASFEMVSLHNPGERGWVRGLLSDGVCGTLGPVNEPYLQSFPPADEFFELLLTGKLTLAEVYWLTSPTVSWMQACVGDPLYTPYRRSPPLAAEDLPAPLRAALQPQPAHLATGP